MTLVILCVVDQEVAISQVFEPPVEGKRWYHRFSALTATAEKNKMPGVLATEKELRAEEVRRLKQRVRRPRVEPGGATTDNCGGKAGRTTRPPQLRR